MDELDALIPAFTEDFDPDQLDLGSVYALARESGKTVFQLMKSKNYPVMKILTGGDGIVGGTVAGDGIDHFEFDPVSKLFNPVSKAPIVKDDNPIITLTASTTAVDMVGDLMEESALHDMVAMAKGTTVFLNHSYRLPQDVFGSVVDAELVRRTLTNPINNETSNFLCLDYKVSPVSQEENPEGWKVYQMLAKGKRRLGASVTVLLLEKSEQPNGRRSIKRVYYLETSMVGIPCNQLSWAALAAKALGIKKWSLPAPAAQIERKSVMDKQVANAPAAEPETAETPNPETTPAAELASKGIYQDRVKAKTSRLYFMFETLSDVIYELKSSAARKIQMDYAAKLQEAIDEFGAALTEAVLPALTAPQDSDSGLAISYYGFTPEDSERLQDQVLSKMVAEMGGGLEFLTKAGKRNNKKDQERIQAMHDHCAELGAKCMESKSADDSDSKAAPVASVSTETDSVPASPVAIGELETKVASLQGAVTSKEAEIAEKDKTIKDLQDQNNQWLACSLAAKAAMKQVLDQPQPRAGQ